MRKGLPPFVSQSPEQVLPVSVPAACVAPLASLAVPPIHPPTDVINKAWLIVKKQYTIECSVLVKEVNKELCLVI